MEIIANASDVNEAIELKKKAYDLLAKMDSLTPEEKGKYLAYEEVLALLRSDDPVRDAERYLNHLEEDEKKRDYITCDFCGGKIYRADDHYEGSTYYVLDGHTICEDCIHDYVEGAAHTYE